MSDEDKNDKSSKLSKMLNLPGADPKIIQRIEETVLSQKPDINLEDISNDF